MTKAEQLANIMADEYASEEVQHLRQDNSLIERTNSDRVILSHDNRRLLND